MNKDYLLDIIEISEKYNIEEYSEIKNILSFIQSFADNYPSQLKFFGESTLRFCDYYEDSFHDEEILNYFDKNYKGCDKNEQMNLFTVYSIFKKANELFEGIEVLGLVDALDLLTESIEDLCLLISTFEKNNIVEETNNLGFDGHKYKLLFTGYSYEDVLFLDKAVMKSLVNRINNILLETDLIPGVEGVDHVREKYNVPLLRMQLANDYRIAFLRKNGVTVIIGIELKSGKNINYTKYDSVARRIDDIYEQVKLLNSGKLPLTHDHYKVLEHLDKIINKGKQL